MQLLTVINKIISQAGIEYSIGSEPQILLPPLLIKLPTNYQA